MAAIRASVRFATRTRLAMPVMAAARAPLSRSFVKPSQTWNQSVRRFSTEAPKQEAPAAASGGSNSILWIVLLGAAAGGGYYFYTQQVSACPLLTLVSHVVFWTGIEVT